MQPTVHYQLNEGAAEQKQRAVIDELVNQQQNSKLLLMIRSSILRVVLNLLSPFSLFGSLPLRRFLPFSFFFDKQKVFSRRMCAY